MNAEVARLNGEAVAAIIGGHVSVGVSGLSEFIQHVQSGKMRAIAVTSDDQARRTSG